MPDQERKRKLGELLKAMEPPDSEPRDRIIPISFTSFEVRILIDALHDAAFKEHEETGSKSPWNLFKKIIDAST